MNGKSTTRIVAAAAIVFTAMLGATGCSTSPSDPDANTGSEITDPVISPEIIAVHDLEGQNVQLTVGQTLVALLPEDDLGGYLAEMTDPSIADFQADTKSGSASFNPGFTALKPGVTDVKLIAANDFVISFKITVKAK